ncbi:hypothetical protein WSM22_08400 [Cytophagales bacterium WSM2-2]|nr:hypothetical protein WSM22_08400 [Cytophagales bacterium WSM2-2]
MAQFIPFDKNVEVLGQSILSLINALPVGRDSRSQILTSQGIKDLKANHWYPQGQVLKAYEAISKQLGNSTLFAIGKAVLDNAIFPPEISNLEKAMQSLDVAYKMNHRGGEIGHYKVITFDSKGKKAVIECKNPYPSEFDRGIISSVLRRFKPADASYKYDVVLDTDQPTRLNGADSCTYNVTW